MPKILYIVTEDWFFVSHFLPMARAARRAGFEVAVLAKIGDKGHRIVAEGFRLLALETSRGSLGPLDALRTLVTMFRTIRAEKPDIVHCIALRPVVLGGIAAKIARVRGLVLAPTGLGYLWSVDGLSIRLLRSSLRWVVGRWLRGNRTRYLFENWDDPAELRISPASWDVTIVGGAGVAPENYPMTAEPPAPPVRFAVVARMIKPKGIAAAVEAIKLARTHGAAVELSLFGDPDPSNPLSFQRSTLEKWSLEPGISWRGHAADVAQVWRDHHVALFLTQYGEGLPRSILEAAAAGRPLVTTDTAGCRDFVRDGQEGIIVAPGDIVGAAAAIARMTDAELRKRMGRAANARVHEGFTENAVSRAVEGVYRSLIDAGRSG